MRKYIKFLAVLLLCFYVVLQNKKIKEIKNEKKVLQDSIKVLEDSILVINMYRFELDRYQVAIEIFKQEDSACAESFDKVLRDTE